MAEYNKITLAVKDTIDYNNIENINTIILPKYNEKEKYNVNFVVICR